MLDKRVALDYNYLFCLYTISYVAFSLSLSVYCGNYYVGADLWNMAANASELKIN